MGQRNYSFDAFMLLADGGAAQTISGLSQVALTPKVLDMGGTPERTDLNVTGGYARIDAAIVLDISAMNALSSNNAYIFTVLGSNSANTASGTMTNPVALGGLTLGYGTAIPLGAHSTSGAAAGTGSDSSAGRYEILFAMEQADINYEFLGLYCAVSGTNASITYTAFGAVLPLE